MCMSPFIAIERRTIMIQISSLNQTIPTSGAVDFNNVELEKGQSVTVTSDSIINLNCKGVYKLECFASLAAASTLQLFNNGIADKTAQGTGTNISFSKLIPVNSNNYPNVCFSQPLRLQIMNTGDAAITLGEGNIISVIVTKVC